MAENMRKREEIEAKYKWDLTAIFPSDREWEQALNAATEHVAGAAAFDGRVAEDPKGAIRTYQALIDEIIPIYEYAFLRKETDNTDPQAQALKDRAMRLYVMGMTATAFLQPELLALPEETLEALEKDPEMKDKKVITMGSNDMGLSNMPNISSWWNDEKQDDSQKNKILDTRFMLSAFA